MGSERVSEGNSTRRRALLLKGGRVLDPSRGIDRQCDVLVLNGVIDSLRSADEPEPAGVEVIEVTDKLVVPGLVDGHVHVYGGIGSFHPDSVGVRAGVTTVVDAASAGTATFADALAAVEGALTRVFNILFIHPQGIGAPITNRAVTSTSHGRALSHVGDVPVGEIVRIADAHRDRIRALKSSAFPDRGPEWVRFVCQVAEWAGLPAYFHIGNFGHDTERAAGISEQFRSLRPGDVVTHIYTAATGGVLDDSGKVDPAVLDAAERGVHFDIGFGPTGFDFEVAEQALAQGVRATSLSTDLQRDSTRKAGYDLVGLMGLMSCLDYSVAEIVAMVTTAPAAMFSLPEAGTLAEGNTADITVLDLEEGDFEYRDMSRNRRRGPLRFSTHLTIRAGEVIEPEPSLMHEPANRRHELSEEPVVMGAEQRRLMIALAELVEAAAVWDPMALHSAAHAVIADSGLGSSQGLQTIYQALLGRPDGPQLGWWFASFAEDGTHLGALLRQRAQGSPSG